MDYLPVLNWLVTLIKKEASNSLYLWLKSWYAKITYFSGFPKRHVNVAMSQKALNRFSFYVPNFEHTHTLKKHKKYPTHTQRHAPRKCCHNMIPLDQALAISAHCLIRQNLICIHIHYFSMSGIYISQMWDLTGEFFGWTRKCFILYISGLPHFELFCVPLKMQSMLFL